MPKLSKTYHKRLAGDTERVITETFEHDNQNRLLVHKHKVDNNPEEILAQNTYNDLSQLTNKKVGGTVASSPLQSIDYLYNIRGWMTRINDPKNLGSKLFGYEIKYNTVEGLETPNLDYTGLKVKPKYNGNIAEVDWRTGTTSGDNLRRYGYVYDSLNRLSAGFYQKDSNPSAKEYFEKMDYDLNGNITNLKRSAQSNQGAAAFNIDELAYTYANNNQSNRLISVTDSSTDYRGYPDVSGITIPYDVNGNMTSQKDKGILQIDYNFLNLPNYMKFDDTYLVQNAFGGINETRNITTKYIFRADGTKVSKLYTYGIARNRSEAYKITEYLDGFQYESNAASTLVDRILRFVPTSEGYYNFENNKYIYNYTDHLGNVRLSYFNNGSSVEVLEENNYYPFGMKHEGYNVSAGNPAYKYSYNGKELQTESGMYNYGARFYMPDIGRWGVVDPLAEHSQNNTPYHYCSGNPINRLDPNGMCDDPNCSHGGLRKAWDSIGRFFGGWGYANKKEGTSKSGNLEVGFLESIGRWLDEPVDSGTAQAAEDLAHSSIPGNFTMPDTNEGVLLSIAVAFGSAMQEANGFRYPRYNPKSTAKFSAKINSRHNLNSTSIAGGKTRSGTFAPKEILDLDIATYNAGSFSNANNGNGDVVINGRIYGIKNEGQTLFPRSGGSPQFQDLSQGQIKAIQLLKTVPANKVDQALKGAGVSNTDINFAKDFINKY